MTTEGVAWKCRDDDSVERLIVLLKCDSSYALTSLLLSPVLNEGSILGCGGTDKRGGTINGLQGSFFWHVSHTRLISCSLSERYDRFQQFEFEETTHRSEGIIGPCF